MLISWNPFKVHNRKIFIPCRHLIKPSWEHMWFLNYEQNASIGFLQKEMSRILQSPKSHSLTTNSSDSTSFWCQYARFPVAQHYLSSQTFAIASASVIYFAMTSGERGWELLLSTRKAITDPKHVPRMVRVIILLLHILIPGTSTALSQVYDD